MEENGGYGNNERGQGCGFDYIKDLFEAGGKTPGIVQAEGRKDEVTEEEEADDDDEVPQLDPHGENFGEGDGPSSGRTEKCGQDEGGCYPREVKQLHPVEEESPPK